MVLGRSVALTVGTRASQCADTTTMARGVPNCPPSPARNRRVGLSCRMTFGAPWERNNAGNVMVSVCSRSTLFPGQPGHPPAVDAVAVALGIAVALESLEHVEAARVARLGRQR